ncbi:hypothetical protein WA588_001286 [Blastocystis sp. NMH]
MFALRQSSLMLRNVWAMRPSMGIAARCFADATEPAKTEPQEKGDPEVIAFINKIVHENKVMLFMKGTPSNPVCGFSFRVVQILKHLGCDFASANILTSKSVVKNLKYVSDWKTYPQLFINGEFVGGCDVVTELFESGELKKMLEKAGAFSEPEKKEEAGATEEKKA